MLPTREQAEMILMESEKLNPGPWGNHCRIAAKCAEKIAFEFESMDADKAYILGLLHDIGRRFGVSHFRHIVDGYHYMKELGYDEVARICLTHSFPIKDINTYIGNFDVSEATLNDMKMKLRRIEYDDYDKLIQLCDCLAMPDGVVELSTRLDDVARRYHRYPGDKRKKFFELKKYFEEKTGKNIYEIVSDDKKLWGL